MQLAIVMPAHDEADGIENVVGSWLRILDGVPGVVIVIDDGSRDRTGELLDRLAEADPRVQVVHQANAGHGAAVLRGYREALATSATHVFQTDSDGQVRAGDFWELWERRRRSPVVVGRRTERSAAFHRRVITRIVQALTRLLFGVRLRDANIPFRLFRAEYLRELLGMVPDDVFAPNIFLSVLAAKSGATLFEVPVTDQERRTRHASLDGWRLARACLRSARELAAFRLSLYSFGGALESVKRRYVAS